VPRPPTADAKVPQSTIEELKALGYLGSDPGATEVPEPSLLPDPKDRIAVHNALHSAMMQEAAGNEAAALASLQRALALEPDSFPGRSQAGMLESRAGNHAATAAHLKRAHALRPKDAAVAFALGDALFGMQDFRGARDALAAALQLDARRYDARLKLGEAERALGNIAAAVSQFEAAALLDPQRTEAEVALARLYLAQGESAKAGALLRRAARRAPQDAAIAALLAEAEQGSKR
jgi:tetratricopeptide (TPR) repeat protein